MGTKKRSRLYNIPVHLSEKQQRKPTKVLRHFFTCYHLQEVREQIEDIIKVAMSSDCPEYEQPDDRSRFMFFVENLNLLVEGAYLMIKEKLPASFTTPHDQQNVS